jgi:hypothetical protein
MFDTGRDKEALFRVQNLFVAERQAERTSKVWMSLPPSIAYRNRLWRRKFQVLLCIPEIVEAIVRLVLSSRVALRLSIVSSNVDDMTRVEPETQQSICPHPARQASRQSSLSLPVPFCCSILDSRKHSLTAVVETSCRKMAPLT